MRIPNRYKNDEIKSIPPSRQRRIFRLPHGQSGFIILMLVAVAGYYAVDIDALLVGKSGRQEAARQHSGSPDDEATKFTTELFSTVDNTWRQHFLTMGKTWQTPHLVMFRGHGPLPCGTGNIPVSGPLYCEANSTVYVDLSFYDEMKQKPGVNADFAQGYVIAHEVGHHVQALLAGGNVPQKTDSRADAALYRELQADCYAGIWGHDMQKVGVLDSSDLQHVLDTVQLTGTERLKHQGNATMDSFTHGTAAQRYDWFHRGLTTGDPARCDITNAPH